MIDKFDLFRLTAGLPDQSSLSTSACLFQKTKANPLACRLNVLEQRAVRLSLLHWQHVNLAKVFQRWKEYKGRRAQLFGSLIALACKWEQPLMEDAWAAWRECTTESRRIQVGHETCSLACLSLQISAATFAEDRQSVPFLVSGGNQKSERDFQMDTCSV